MKLNFSERKYRYINFTKITKLYKHICIHGNHKCQLEKFVSTLNVFIAKTSFPNNCWKHHVISRHQFRAILIAAYACKAYARLINQINLVRLKDKKASVKKCRAALLLPPLLVPISIYRHVAIVFIDQTFVAIQIDHDFRSPRSLSNTFHFIWKRRAISNEIL